MPREQSADLMKDLLDGGLARDEVKPPVTPRVQVLPFNQLSWENFERLCTRLVASDGGIKDCHRYGVRGDFQAGIDILAHRRTAEGRLERWCYQCKRWQKMTPGDLRQIVEKFDFNNTDRYVVMVSLEASAGLRDVVADRPEVDLWDAEDISRQLKGRPELVEDFFGAHWRNAFCPADQQTIKHHLGLDHPQTVIVEEIKAALDAAPRGPMFEAGGLCSGYLLNPVPDSYFVAQEFGPDRNDLREALTAALAEFGVQSIRADDFLWPGHILCKISALIQSTPFGVYQLTVSQNRNVHLELGIAIGLGRPFVLVKDKDAEVSPLAQGLDYYPIDSYLELRYEFGQKVHPFLADIANYCPQALPPSGSQRTAVIAHGDLDVLDFCVPVAKMISEYGLTPVILGDPTGNLTRYLEMESVPHQIIGGIGRTRLDETVAAIQAARLGVYRIEKAGAPDTFLALGVSMGLNRPGLLIHKAKVDPPSDVKGLSALKFDSYTSLKQFFPERFGHLLRRYS